MERKTSSPYYDFCEDVRKSDAFLRMTGDEQGRLWDALHAVSAQNILTGKWMADWKILQAVHDAFLAGLGYDGPNWRKPLDIKEVEA